MSQCNDTGIIEPDLEDMIVETDQTKSRGEKRPMTTNKTLSQEEINETIDSLGSKRSVQITKFGIGFFTGECILSNHYKVKSVYNGRDHTSSEQAYFAECAIAAKDPE